MRRNAYLYRWLSMTLSWVVCVQMLCAANGVIQNDPNGTPPPDRLKITILDGEGALNNIKLRTAREPIVQVTDENHKPVAGATVVFLLPGNGPGGTFLNGTKTLTTTTDQNGQAVARGLKPNGQQGQFVIHVTANFEGMVGHALIAQTNIAAAAGAAAGATVGMTLGMKLLIIGLVAAAAGTAGGVYAATHSGSSPKQTPVGITAGSGTVGAP